MAYDWLAENKSSKSVKEYLGILHLAARRNECMVDYALGSLIDEERTISIESVESIMDSLEKVPSPVEITIEQVDLCVYDALLNTGEEVQACYQMN